MQQIDFIQETLHPKSENPTPAWPACPELSLAVEIFLYRNPQAPDTIGFQWSPAQANF